MADKTVDPPSEHAAAQKATRMSHGLSPLDMAAVVGAIPILSSRLDGLIGRYHNDARHTDVAPPPPSVPAAVLRQLSTPRRKTYSHSTNEPTKGRRRKCILIAGGCLRTIRVMGEDWFFLGLLGVIMAILSYGIDKGIEYLHMLHAYAYTSTSTALTEDWQSLVVSYAAWTSFAVLLVLATTAFVNWLAPQAIGSGIPEMKTILKGVVLKEYLTLNTLVAKMVGLTAVLGSGMPIGKEGPFVHVASIVATQLSLFITSFKGIYENESRKSEMLSAACAVGVACTFAAPIGGVLFSIEVTSVFFAVRNYWRGFFAAACSALIFRLLDVFTGDDDAMASVFKTTLPNEKAFYPAELFAFAIIAVICGLAGALFVLTHRLIVLTLRNSSIFKRMVSHSQLVYPLLVTLLVSTLTYPSGIGKYMRGDIKLRAAIHEFFSGFSFQQTNLTSAEWAVAEHWHNDEVALWTSLTLFALLYFLMAALANTMPVPAGVFIPTMAIGACFGRLFGEAMWAWFPDGLEGDGIRFISPGVYAVVGAASFTGAVTHTISVSVIILELTGSVSFILPIMIAVIIANFVAALLQPSIYDSIIQIKHLPYLPDIPASNSVVHSVHAESIMVSNVAYVSADSTYGEVQDMIYAMPRLRAFPLVDRDNSMILLGSITKRRLTQVVDSHVGAAARLREARRRSADGRTMGNVGHRSQRPSILPPTIDEGKATKSTRFVVSKTEGGDVLEPTAGRREQPLIEISVTPPRDSLSEGAEASRKSSSITMNYSTVHGHASSLTSPLSPKAKHSLTLTVGSAMHTVMSYMAQLTARGKDSTGKQIINADDMSQEERCDWEKERLAERLDLSLLSIDPAPFQLVERTSLYKTHSLFSLLGLNRAYVTNCGRLVGVVALRELRSALEAAQRGERPNDDEEEEETESDGNETEEEIEPLDCLTQTEPLGKLPYSTHHIQ